MRGGRLHSWASTQALPASNLPTRLCVSVAWDLAGHLCFFERRDCRQSWSALLGPVQQHATTVNEMDVPPFFPASGVQICCPRFCTLSTRSSWVLRPRLDRRALLLGRDGMLRAAVCEPQSGNQKALSIMVRCGSGTVRVVRQRVDIQTRSA